MGINPVEFRGLWYRLSEIEQQRLIAYKREQFRSSLQVGTVIWTKDDLSGVPKVGSGEHPLVIMKIDGATLVVTAYLRTSRDAKGERGCFHTPAGLVSGLDKDGYIVVANPIRLRIDDMADGGCRIGGCFPPDWVEKIRGAIRAYQREQIMKRKGRK